MVLLSPAVQMSAAVAASTGRSRLSATPQYINAAAALQPALQNVTGYRYVVLNILILSSKHNVVVVPKHKWMGHVLQHDGLLRDVLEGRMLGKRTRGRRRIQLIDHLLSKKNYTDLKKASEDGSVLKVH